MRKFQTECFHGFLKSYLSMDACGIKIVGVICLDFRNRIGYRESCQIAVTIKPLLHQSPYGPPALAPANAFTMARSTISSARLRVSRYTLKPLVC